MTQKNFIVLFIGVTLSAGLVFGGRYFFHSAGNNLVACTQDAKQCPDGSYVGRTGPKCEFAACPEPKDETANWKTYRNEKYGFEVRYPSLWKLRWIPGENEHPETTYLESPDNDQFLVVPTADFGRGLPIEPEPEYRKSIISIDGLTGMREDLIYMDSKHPYTSTKITFVVSPPKWRNDGWIEIVSWFENRIVAETILSTFKFIEPSAPVSLSETELKYRLFEKFSPIFFCDPDYYPIARQDENQAAAAWFAAVDKNSDEFKTVLRYNNLTGATELTAEQKLLIYRDYKKLHGISFEASGTAYTFHLHTGGGNKGDDGMKIDGMIDKTGAITITKQEKTFNTCPICTTPK